MSRTARRCGICRETGHNRRNCPNMHLHQQLQFQQQQQQQQMLFQQQQQQQQQQHQQQQMLFQQQQHHLQIQQQEQFCVLCGSPHHATIDCPILNDDVMLPSPPPPPPPPPSSTPLTVSSSHKIHWDACGKCGLPNNGGICSCGEKQVAPVAPNEEGIYECMICYTYLKELNKVTTKCGHHYCVDCFLLHFTSSNPSSKSCPICRAKLLEVKSETRSQEIQQSFSPQQQPFQNILEGVVYDGLTRVVF